jgi:uncharacterized protein (TIGR02246 family)
MSNDDRQAVVAANAAFYRAFEKKDLDAMGQVWSQGAASLCVHPGREALQGWEAIRQSWQQIFKATSYLEIDVNVLTVEIGGDLAYAVLIENVLQVSGRRRMEARSMATNGFERMGGQWYLIHHHGSPIMQ